MPTNGKQSGNGKAKRPVKAKARPVKKRRVKAKAKAKQTKPTPKKGAKFLKQLVETGGNVSLAASLAGINRQYTYQVRKDNDAFAAAWDEAIEEGTENLEQEAYRRAMYGCNEPVYQGGNLVGHIQRYSDTLTIFLLKARRPEKYRERQSIEHSGPGGGPIQTEVDLSSLSNKELRTMQRLVKKAKAAEVANGAIAGQNGNGNGKRV